MGKEETRGISQPYLLTLQLISLSMLVLTYVAIFHAQFGLLLTLPLPGALLGAMTSVALSAT